MKDQGVLPVREARAGTADRERIIGMVDAMRSVIAPHEGQLHEIDHILALQMAAAATLAGAIFGQMLAVGLVRDQDTRRAVELAGRQFREGIKVGKAQAARVAAEMVHPTPEQPS